MIECSVLYAQNRDTVVSVKALCYSMTSDSGLSKVIPISVSCMTILFSVLTNHQFRHQVMHSMGCQTGDCKWPVKCMG